MVSKVDGARLRKNKREKHRRLSANAKFEELIALLATSKLPSKSGRSLLRPNKVDVLEDAIDEITRLRQFLKGCRCKHA